MQKAILQAQALIGWALLVVLMVATLALGANRPVSWTLMAMAVMGLFAILLLFDLLQRRPPVFNQIWLPAILFMAVLLWGTVQISPSLLPASWFHPVWQLVPDSPGRVAADPAQGLHMLMRLASYAMVFWISMRVSADKDLALRYLRAFAVFSMALAGFGIYAAVTGNNPILGDLGNSNVSASFVNRNNYATFAGFGLVTCLALLLRAASHGQTGRSNAMAGMLQGMISGGWIWLAGVTLTGGALMLSLSRGGAAAAIVGVLVLLATRVQRGNRASWVPVVIVGVIVGAVFLSAATGTMNRVVTTSDEAGRFAVFPAIVQAIADRPLLGHGLGGFQTAFRASVPAEAAMGEWDMAHNSYLENAFELGLPAALVFYAALALIGWRLWRGVRDRRQNRTPVSISLACFLLAAFHALFDFSLQMPALAGVFAWLLGLGVAQSWRSSDLGSGPR
ncbi:O-antigen ligase family protein [Rhodophyticola sp.]|uniref:O-antigen ligase family protein n=1 Tax=Rhodophyticola sp. TaxID=2680032 RepID=UPI003D29AB5D